MLYNAGSRRKTETKKDQVVKKANEQKTNNDGKNHPLEQTKKQIKKVKKSAPAKGNSTNKKVASEEKVTAKEVGGKSTDKTNDTNKKMDISKVDIETLIKILEEGRSNDILEVNGRLTLNVKDLTGKTRKFVSKHEITPLPDSEKEEHNKKLLDVQIELLEFLLDIVIKDDLFKNMPKNALLTGSHRNSIEYIINNEIYDKETKEIKLEYKKLIESLPKFYMVKLYVVQNGAEKVIPFYSPHTKAMKKLLGEPEEEKDLFQQSLYEKTISFVAYNSLLAIKGKTNQDIYIAACYLPKDSSELNQQITINNSVKIEYPSHTSKLDERQAIGNAALFVIYKKLMKVLDTVSEIEGFSGTKEQLKENLWTTYMALTE